jgi:hypothetical protein
MISMDATAVAAPPGTILLGAYAARSCPVKTQNAYNPTVLLETPNVGASIEANDGLAELFDGGAQFEAAVLDQLIDSYRGRVVDLRPLAASTSEVQIEACLRAMSSGAEVIIGGCLPVDLSGHRVGSPDLLIRSVDRANRPPGYHPVEVKWHRIIARSRPAEDNAEEPHMLRGPKRRSASRDTSYGSVAGRPTFSNWLTITGCWKPAGSALTERWPASSGLMIFSMHRCWPGPI